MKDYIDLYNEEDARLCNELKKRPKCVCCKEPIQSEKAYLLGDSWYCEDCEDEFFDEIRKEYLVDCE